MGPWGLSGTRASGRDRRHFSGSASLFRGKMREFRDFGGHLDRPAFLVPRLSGWTDVRHVANACFCCVPW